ncbi:beta-1,4-glucuronyltransferase 1-like [Scaptodrosophila lebanonensis]|uniref:Beta-1,4-glucuronyltransferase 1-like n=1 Tax=Drosophila lebanonensis TaxID=7225 RepID=A0A6J2TYQ8_DROLE|nr:beta-1,4-glucuronyltransferase 1-like [Scaptodrosophila lebanonensis]
MWPKFGSRVCVIRLLFFTLLVFGGLSYFLFSSTTFDIFQKKNPTKRPPYSDLPHFQLQQNGEYWIFNDFIEPDCRNIWGKSSITLTTHATYIDFKLLEWLLVRWNAPISMAVYVDGEDFERTVQSFYHIKFCSVIGKSFFQWVSVQLVFHNSHFPRKLRPFSHQRPRKLRCKTLYQRGRPNETSWYKNDLTYPLSLLKNVARANARTYYIFSLGLDMLPPRRFVKNFLDLMDTIQVSVKSVFCVPVFPQLTEDMLVPKDKSELLTQLWPYFNGSIPLVIPDDELQRLRDLFSWLLQPLVDVEQAIFKISKQPNNCDAYVSINHFEPIYDQHAAGSLQEQHLSHLEVLSGLNFDFIVLGGAFLIKRHAPIWQDVEPSEYPVRMPDPTPHISDLIVLSSMVL